MELYMTRNRTVVAYSGKAGPPQIEVWLHKFAALVYPESCLIDSSSRTSQVAIAMMP